MEDLEKKYTIDDIDNFIITEEKESNRIEFKSGHELSKLYNKEVPPDVKDIVKDNIAKDISSFANSSGGIIVYGIQTKNDRAKKIVSFDASQITPETLEKIIDSRIEKKVKYRIDTIELEGNIEKSIYVIVIPQSSEAPHMVCDKYYRRYNFKSVPMAEYEVRSSYFKPTLTQLEIAVPTIECLEHGYSGGKIVDYNVIVGFNVKNTGKAIEKNFKLEIKIPNSLYLIEHRINETFRSKFSRAEEKFSLFSVPSLCPIFQEELMTVTNIIYNIKRKHLYEPNLKFSVKLYYSSEIKDFSFNLQDYLTYQNKRKLTANDLWE